jgi:hypothetical protein
MPESILDKTKKMLGFESDYTDFDTDIIVHINAVFSTLHQLGIGPADGYMIESKANAWEEFTSGLPYSNAVKSYMYLRVRLLFDPPGTSFAIDAIKDQIKETEWRLSVASSPAVTYIQEGGDDL